MSDLYTKDELGNFVLAQNSATLISPVGSGDVKQQYADLIRDQWDDWKKTYQPFEEHYAALLTDPKKAAAFNGAAMGYVQQGVDSSYNRGLAELGRRDQRYGVGLDNLERAARDRTMQANKQATLAKGLSDMSGYLKERRLDMMSGGIQNGRAT